MEEKILECVIVTLFDLKGVLTGEIIEELNNIFKTVKIPYIMKEDKNNYTEYKIIKVNR